MQAWPFSAPNSAVLDRSAATWCLSTATRSSSAPPGAHPDTAQVSSFRRPRASRHLRAVGAEPAGGSAVGQMLQGVRVEHLEGTVVQLDPAPLLELPQHLVDRLSRTADHLRQVALAHLGGDQLGPGGLLRIPPDELQELARNSSAHVLEDERTRQVVGPA